METLRGLRIEPKVVPQHAVMDGINAVRRMLDRTWIDEERCARGLDALRLFSERPLFLTSANDPSFDFL